MAESINPAAPHHLPSFITAPGQTDVLMVVMSVFLLIAILAFGILFFRLHTLPERMAHKSQKVQFEIVAVLGLIALFTHMHIFWIAGLLLALIEVPDFSSLNRIAGSVEKIAGVSQSQGPEERPIGTATGINQDHEVSTHPSAGTPLEAMATAGLRSPISQTIRERERN